VYPACFAFHSCVLLKERLATAVNDEERRKAQAEKDKHIALCRAEREEAMRRQKLALDHPDRCDATNTVYGAGTSLKTSVQKS
jgi:hypothetical protein